MSGRPLDADPPVVPVTAFFVGVERTDAGDIMTLRYLAGDVPFPGQLVSLHHGPVPTELPAQCATCGDHKTVPCPECDGSCFPYWSGDPTEGLMPCNTCEGTGDQACPDCRHVDQEVR